ncbi:MAG: hypothetical protein AB7T06_07030 [Kofleriaceae bacterium]
MQIFAHFIAVPCVTHVKPAAHLTVDEHVAPCPAVPAMRQSAICLLAAIYVAVNKSQVQFVGQSGFVAAAGSQFEEHAVAPGAIGMPPELSSKTH